MCGIAGFVSKSEKQDIGDYIENIVKSIKHRGPDEHGVFNDGNVCLLNTRLSIVDVEHGHQPFLSDEKDIVVIQNGEIYNFIEVRMELQGQGIKFNTNSDTEVILRSYEYYGTSCFEKFNGMFAISIYDKTKDIVILARDRLGVKPLYIYQKDSEIHFSSEIKSFFSFDSFDGAIDSQSIHNYMKFNYIPIPNTIYSFVKHIEPASFYEINTKTLEIKTVKYWKISNSKEHENLTEEESIDKIDEILTDAIRIRLRSDVGIGAFLSGGLDSSLICAMIKDKFDISLDTYSIGFEDKKFDESVYAKQVAEYCGLRNRTHILQSDVIHLWNVITWSNDQPHGDISFIPTYILSQFAAKDYKVVFTGDGGDEAFAGYTKYFGIANSALEEYFNAISLVKDDEVFDRLYSKHFKSIVNYTVPKKIFDNAIEEVSNKDNLNKALYFDMKHLLPGNNLVKSDRMTMANSLEARSPLLDYRIFELMYCLPGSLKLQGKETKHILKKFALQYLPRDVVYRDKQMFTVPVGEWFKGELKSFVTEIINSDSLRSRGIFNNIYLKKILEEHLSETKNHTRELRAIVNLELWFRNLHDHTGQNACQVP